MSAFNLSSLVAAQEYRLQQQQQQQQLQTSVHFWRCHLTAETPSRIWNPSTAASASVVNNSVSNGDKKKNDATENDGDGDSAEEAAAEIDEDSATHELVITGCVLGPQASGVHLVGVRCPGYHDQDPLLASACPIACIDPGVQRTLALAQEFVLDSAIAGICSASKNGSNRCIEFQLMQGSGPVWLTGTHRVHQLMTGPEEADGDEEPEDSEEEEEGEEEEQDVSEEDIEDEDEDEAKEADNVKIKNGRAAGKLPKQQQQKQQQQRRKRQRPSS